MHMYMCIYICKYNAKEWVDPVCYLYMCVCVCK
jgi:hypothetical protein